MLALTTMVSQKSWKTCKHLCLRVFADLCTGPKVGKAGKAGVYQLFQPSWSACKFAKTRKHKLVQFPNVFLALCNCRLVLATMVFQTAGKNRKACVYEFLQACAQVRQLEKLVNTSFSCCRVNAITPSCQICHSLFLGWMRDRIHLPITYVCIYRHQGI